MAVQIKLTNKLIDTTIASEIGEDVLPVVHYLRNKKNISEFKLAEVVEEEVNIVRNMLYRLHDKNLVSFIRKKDKKKGWYIYYWTFNVKFVRDLVLNMKKRRLEMLIERVAREKDTQYYTCNTGCIRLDFERATNFEFKCPECGELVEMEDNTQKIASFEKEIKTLTKELKVK